jgi:hypothetical protein
MAKGQKKDKTKSSSIREAVLDPPREFGRPPDDSLEAFYMKKQKNGKIQTINAESEAELLCHEYEIPHLKGSNGKALEKEFGADVEEKLRWVRTWFSKMDSDHYELMWNAFNEAVSRWEYTEVHSEEDF